MGEGMNDYEINRRLAEIADVDVLFCVDTEDNGRRFLLVVETMEEWNPLCDWHQIGPLVEAYVTDVGRHHYYDGQWTAWARMSRNERDVDVTDDDLKRAIALAIIAAHDDIAWAIADLDD